MIEALINIAKINDEVSHEKFQLIEQRIARSKIDPQTKLALLGNIESDHSYEVDFDLLAADRDIARETFDAMQEIAAMGDKMTMAEKIYLQMAAQKLGIENNA